MPPSNERLRAALVITAAVILAALFAWSFVRDVGAQGICAWLCGEFCESLDDTLPRRRAVAFGAQPRRGRAVLVRVL